MWSSLHVYNSFVYPIYIPKDMSFSNMLFQKLLIVTSFVYYCASMNVFSLIVDQFDTISRFISTAHPSARTQERIYLSQSNLHTPTTIQNHMTSTHSHHQPSLSQPSSRSLFHPPISVVLVVMVVFIVLIYPTASHWPPPNKTPVQLKDKNALHSQDCAAHEHRQYARVHHATIE